jgi:uncharacterized protein YegP (UPF0339 family)
MAVPHYEIYEHPAGQWRWRLWTGTRKIATSGEWFTRREDAVRSVQNVRRVAPVAEIQPTTAFRTRKAAPMTPEVARLLTAKPTVRWTSARPVVGRPGTDVLSVLLDQRRKRPQGR